MFITSTFTILAFIISTFFIPRIIKFCNLHDIYDTVNARKIHSGNIPRLGGVAIALSFIICTVTCFALDKKLSFFNSMPLLTAGMLIFTAGLIDDLIELKAIYKLLIQIIASAIVVINGFYFRQIFGLTLFHSLGMFFTFFWILGIINAYNLIDGLDGLCGMLSFTTLITLGAVLNGAYTEGSAVCFILAAATAGFLVFNKPPAKIFMGDNGSQFLGFMIATIPLYSSTPKLEYNKFLIMLVIVSFPMLDTIAAIWRRIRDKRHIMSPDRLHLHHKLLNIGFSKTQSLLIITIIQLLICVTVYFNTFLNKIKSIMLLLGAYLLMIIFFSIIHYSNRASIKKMK